MTRMAPLRKADVCRAGRVEVSPSQKKPLRSALELLLSKKIFVVAKTSVSSESVFLYSDELRDNELL